MQRRSFVKSLSSLLLVPLLRYQPADIDRHKLLGMFLGDDACNLRFDLTRPYVVGDHAYASDGRVMARIDTDESECDDKSIKVPPVGYTWNKYYAPYESWKPFRLVEVEELLPALTNCGMCPLCDDRRVSYGSAYPTTEADVYGKSYDPDDNTIRDESCPVCHGRQYDKRCYQGIGDIKILYRYAKKLAAIPGCEVTIGRNVFNDESWQFKTPLLLFRSDVGIGGIVMPIVK